MAKIMKFYEKLLTGGREMAIIFALGLTISSMLTWGSTANVFINGLQGDGKIVICLGILAFIFLFVRRVPLAVSLILGLLGLTAAFIDFQQMANAVLSIRGSVGVGLHLALISSIGMVLGVIVEMFEERKSGAGKKLYYLDK